MKKESLKILVCCHKLDSFKSDDVYMPIHVGKATSSVDLGIQGDDEGDNISAKNANYCELTGLYWAWKSLKNVDYIGLCHYRRYFNFNKRGTLLRNYTLADNIDDLDLDVPSITKLFSCNDIVLTKPKVYRYSLYVNYCKCHLSKDINLVEDIIINKYPEYERSIEQVIHRNNKLSHYNMFIMKWSDFDKYCEWLFSILQEAEKKIDVSNYDATQGRVYGYIAERLLNVYVYHNKMRVKYTPIYWVTNNSRFSTLLTRMLSQIFKTISFACNKYFDLIFDSRPQLKR